MTDSDSLRASFTIVAFDRERRMLMWEIWMLKEYGEAGGRTGGKVGQHTHEGLFQSGFTHAP